MKKTVFAEAINGIDPFFVEEALHYTAKSEKTRKAWAPAWKIASLAAAALLFVSILLIWNRPGTGLVDPIPDSTLVAFSSLTFDLVPVSDATRPDALDVVYLPGLALPGASTETVQFAGLSVSEPLYEALTENRNQYYCIRVDGADASDVETFRDAGVFFEVVNDTLYIYPSEEQLETLNGISGTLGEPCTLSLSTDPVIGEAWEKYVVQRQFTGDPYIYSRLGLFITSASFGSMIRDPALVGQFLDLLLSLEDYLVCPIVISHEDEFNSLVAESGAHGEFKLGDEDDILLYVSFGPDYVFVGAEHVFGLNSEGRINSFRFTHLVEYRINADPKPLVDALKEIPTEEGLPSIPEKYRTQTPPAPDSN